MADPIRDNDDTQAAACRLAAAIWQKTSVFLCKLLLFPVDCLFCLYDFFAVNVRKTSLIDEECGGWRSGEEEPCVAGAKYTNRWLFRLVCPEMQIPDNAPWPVCGAQSSPEPRFIRAVLICAAAAGVVVIGGIVLLVAPRSVRTPDPVPVSEEAIEAERRGNLAFEAGRPREALQHFRRAMRDGLRNPEIFWLVGRCLHELEQTEDALLFLHRVADSAEGVPEAAELLGEIYYWRGRIELAADYARQAIEQGLSSEALDAIVAHGQLSATEHGTEGDIPEWLLSTEVQSGPGKLARARALMQMGRLQEAGQMLDELEEGSASRHLTTLYRARLLWEMGDIDRSISRLEELVRRPAPPSGARALLVDVLLTAGRETRAMELADAEEKLALPPAGRLRLARTLHRHGRMDRALGIALRMTEDSDVGSHAHLLAAGIYLQMNLPRQALRHAELALEERPDWPDALLLAGRAARAMDAPARGRTYLRRARQARPDWPLLLRELGKALSEDRMHSEALAHLEEASRLNPDSGQIRYQYGAALAAAGQPENARKQLEKAVSLLASPYQACTLLGRLAAVEGNREEAIRYYSRAVEDAPGRAVVAANELALHLMEEDRDLPFALALAHFAYLRSSPEQADHTSNTLTKALIRTDSPARALTPARRAASAKPRDADRQLRLGIAEAAAGNTERARRALEKAAELGARTDTGRAARRLLREPHQRARDDDASQNPKTTRGEDPQK